MKRKKIIALVAALAVSALGFGALSYFSGTAEKKENQFNIVAGQKDQNDAGTIQEPAQDAGGKADAAAGLQPDQIVPKDPYIVSNVDQSAQAIMKVEVPKFTEAPNKGKLAAELLNINADGKQKLLNIQDTDEWHTVIYGYTEPLAGNNSTKPEEERARTSSLFNSFKITGDISLANTYTGAIKVTGTLIQAEGSTTVDEAASNANISTKNYTITYNANGGYFNNDHSMTTNKVSYALEVDSVKKIAKTPNIQDDGTDDGNGYGTEEMNEQVITIPGATQLDVTVTYQTAFENDGRTPLSVLIILNKDVDLDNMSDEDSVDENVALFSPNKVTNKYTVPGDTVKFIFMNEGGENNKYYGYYATVEAGNIPSLKTNGAEIIPDHDSLYFQGWYTTSECLDGTKINPVNCNSNITVYAKYGKEKCATLLDSTINEAIKERSGLTAKITDIAKNPTEITAFQHSDAAPTSKVMTKEHIISSDDSNYPIYLWRDGTTLKWQSAANKVYANKELAGLFAGMIETTQTDPISLADTTDSNIYFVNLTDISGLKDWDTSNVSNMLDMFYGCSDLNDLSPLAEWNVENVNNMASMFGSCISLSNISALSSQNTENVIDMSKMFYWCKNLTDISALSSQNTENVTNMSRMFDTCKNIADISAISSQNTLNVQDMSAMFIDCDKLSDISALSSQNTENTTNMQGMFAECESLTNISGLSSQNTTQLKDIGYMFSRCNNLSDIIALSSQNTTQMTDMSGAFESCNSLTDISALSSQNTTQVTNMYGVFENCNRLADISALSAQNTAQVTNMDRLFSKCNSLTDISALSSWNTANVISMNQMFSNCINLTDASGINDQDILNVNRYSFGYMFENCPSHPEFTNRAGTQTDNGTFDPQLNR